MLELFLEMLLTYLLLVICFCFPGFMVKKTIFLLSSKYMYVCILRSWENSSQFLLLDHVPRRVGDVQGLKPHPRVISLSKFLLFVEEQYKNYI